MKPSMKLLAAVAAAFLIGTLVVSAVHAQCVPNREFAMRKNPACGRTEVKTDIEIPLTQTGAIGAVWEVGNALGNNGGGPHFGTDASCPSSIWWLQGANGGTDPAGWSVQGFVGSTACTLSGTACPAQLAVLIEDTTADLLNAGFFVVSSDADAACTPRYWNFCRATGAFAPAVDNQVGMYAFPTVGTTGSSGPPPNTTLTNVYRDAGNAPFKTVYFANPAGPAPASGIITSYDVYIHQGTTEPLPLRHRSAWTYLKSVQYQDGPVADSVQVPCSANPAEDTYVAVGVSVDGTFVAEDVLPTGAVHSFYVGSSTAVECDPNLADPDDNKLTRPRRKIERRPATRRGR